MAACESTTLYPLHRCKILHLVRHGQGYHNARELQDTKASLSYDYFDASLTTLGWQQVDIVRKHVVKTGIASRIELVVTSPLLRTMQTAVGLFGGGDYLDGVASPPLMLAGAGNSDRAAISSLGCPPFMAAELCREHMGLFPCDKRRSITEYQSIFPAIDFTLIETDEDVLWQPEVREKEEEVAARGRDFLNWLWTRQEKEIAIVSHGGFLRHTLQLFGNDCHSIVRDEIQKSFTNCELRSVVIADSSAIGTHLATTDLSGQVPLAPDVSSEDIDMLENGNTSAS
eukprot:Gb_07938 [translate_table: standard]